MSAEDWTPTAALRFVERKATMPIEGMHLGAITRRVRILQQRWVRKCVDYRQIMGGERRVEWFEHEWRDVRFEAEEAVAGKRTPQPGDLDYPDSTPDTGEKHG